MRRLFLLMCMLVTFSCKEDEVEPTNDLYNEWEWVLTTFETRGRPVSAQKSDTTYYHKFTKAGQLEIRDINKELKQEYSFTLIDGESFNSLEIQGMDQTWGYSISRDTLRIWESASIFPMTVHFKKN